ncbi:hypothetical protein QBC34DRAFT_494211 [Podospora aff. communis PSN243]|uniref:Fe2OG dioxygenase domain-containing protein n=1 Tax=Podospora aff. communis PSN243 TaxID=3040156 RepID=A0AAV9GP00_9PEZI|nr:hypothetical protein QBC34DRAFT_494211 [Podospora aff. communis PSN243]
MDMASLLSGPPDLSNVGLDLSNPHMSDTDQREAIQTDWDPKDDIGKALEPIQAVGTFAAFTSLKESDIQPTFVHGVGPVGFPLQGAAARQLIEKAQQAPYGKGGETLVDTSVRNTWELDAAQLDLSPKWAATVDWLSNWVSSNMGTTSAVIVQLYKMLIYEKGAMFKPHTDTEKIPGMFGTLVVCLPSKHEGGDLVIKHRNDTKTFKTSESQPSAACWFSDVTHEVLPVISGIRCVLTFNLAVSQSSERPSAGINDPETDGVRRAMIVCDGLDVSLFFAVLELREDGGCEEVYPEKRKRDYFDDYDNYGSGSKGWHEFIEVYESETVIKKLVNTEGVTLRSDMKIDASSFENNLIQDIEDPFEKGQRHKEDYSGHTGNEGVTATHWYRVTVAVIIPNDAADSFLIQGVAGHAAQDLLAQHLTKYADPAGTKDKSLRALSSLAGAAWSSAKFKATKNEFDPATVVFDITTALRFFEVVLSHRQYDLFNKAVGWLQSQAAAIAAPLFTVVGSKPTEEDFDLNPVKESLLKLSGDSARKSLILHWATRDVVPAAITASSGPGVTEADGAATVNIVKDYCDLELFRSSCTNSIVPIISNKARLSIISNKAGLSPFALSAVVTTIESAGQGIFDEATTLELCKPLLQNVLASLNLTWLVTFDKTAAPKSKSSTTQGSGYGHHQPPSRPAHIQPNLYITPELLARCFGACIQRGWDDLVTLLSSRIVAQAGNIPPAQFRPLWIPFLCHLITRLESARCPLSTSWCQELACAIMTAYLTKYIGKEPLRGADNRKPPVSCTCADCQALNRFLQSNERVWRFPADKPRRWHLHNVLDSSRSGCSHDTDRSTYPETLVVAKYNPAQEKRETWEERFSEAWADFARFDQEKLKMLLGEQWEPITTMRDLRLVTAPTQLEVPVHPHDSDDVQEIERPAGLPTNLVAGMKRPTQDWQLVADLFSIWS